MRLIAVLALVFALVTPFVASARTTAAPLDEYFGPLKMSVLEIGNRIHDTDTRMRYNPELASRHYTGLYNAEVALEDWARKYPNDSWIPARAYDMSHLFWRMHTPAGNAQAERCRSLLFRQFGHSRYTRLARGESSLMFGQSRRVAGNGFTRNGKKKTHQ